MSDFVDDRAAEEPEEQEERQEDEPELPEDEEEASEGEGGSDDDDDDSSAEGDDEDEFENDGFIVDEEEEEGGGDEDKEGSDVEGAAEAKKRRRKKRRRTELVLDEEDYELLEDNTGIRRQRPQQQHRRIKRARDAEGGAVQQQQDAARALQEELFGLEDDGLEDEDEDEEAGGAGAKGGAADRDRARGDSRQGAREEAPIEQADDQFYDDEDDWLVHEDEEEGGDGRAAAAQRRRRRRAALEGMPDIDPDALAEADEIFGNVDDLLAMYEERKAHRDGGEEEEEEEAEEEDDLDDDAAEARRLAREERQRAAAAKRMQEQLDPEAMARHFLLPRDEQIREIDVPEREQLHRGPDPANFDLAACAAWVWEHLVGRRVKAGKVTEMLEDGVREVEGPPPTWYGSSHWDHRDLAGGLTDVASHRALYRGRADDRARREWRHSAEARQELVQAIQDVLSLAYEKHMEIPFIAQYRKEVCGELLAVRSKDEPKGLDSEAPGFPRGAIRATNRRIRRYEVLYAVQQLAQRWKAMQVRREARRRAYEKALGDTMHSDEQAAIQACLDLLNEAESMEELEDCEAKFRLATQQFGAEDMISQLSLGAGGGRRPQKSTSYALCLRAGLGDWVAGLGLTAAQVAENVEAGYKKHIPTDLEVTPMQHSQQFVAEAGGFSTPEAVAKGGCHVAATQLAAEPLIRQEVRKFYQDNAAVWTKPTAEGETTLTAFHPLGGAKRLAGKPLRKFEGSDLFLRVLQAEKGGMITVQFGLDQEKQAELLKSLAESYLSGGLSDAAVAWDEVRHGVLSDTLRTLLLPAMEREARAAMAADARAAVLEASADRLWGYASQAPLQVRLVDEEDLEPDRRVMAVCYGPGKPATTFVMLDPAGNLIDFLHCPQYSGPIPKRKALLGEVYDLFQDAKKGADAQRIRQFIETHKPHAIVVGASSPEARTLEQDLCAIRESIVIDNPRFVIELGTGELQIMMADEAVAAAWENSSAGREELAASSPAAIVRRAVALGRQLLDPLALLASLCGRGKEVLALQLHPLQGQIPEDERLAMVDRVLTTATSQVGIDLNAVVSSTWLHAPLQFVPGLGPRKAAALLRAVQRAGGYAESRSQIWREMGVLGKAVFKNAAAYLRVRASTKGTANLDMDPLDDTRIHPESYRFATEMAKSAVQGADGGDADDEVAVENAFARPQDVEVLDVVYYDRHLQDSEAAERGPGAPPPRTRLATLIDIQMEFAVPYGELRRELEPLKSDEAFYLCAGETKETLRRGRRVEARVRTVGEMDARCVLPDLNNIEAVLERDQLSSRAGPEVSVRDFLQPNQTVGARIIEVDPSNWVVKLCTRSNVVGDELAWEAEYLGYNEERKTGDKYYRVPTPAEVKEAAHEARRRAAAPKFKARPIQHPLFKNVSINDATSELAAPEEPVGRCIIRPSTRGPQFLCITMKLPESMWHVDIEEKGKGSIKLGSSLEIEWTPGGKRETYEDLDEVTARYIEPVQDLLDKLVKHRKWQQQSWERAKEDLRVQKAAVPPAQGVYCLGTDGVRPGAFWLGYIISTNPYREYFMVTPDGYRFRKKEYPTVDHMLRSWQKSPRPPSAGRAEPPPPPPPMQRQASPRHAPPQARQQGVPQGMAAGLGPYYGEQQPPLPPQQVYGGYGEEQPPPPPSESGYGGGGGGFGGAPAAGGYWQGPPQQGMGASTQPPGPGFMPPAQAAMLAAQRMAANFEAQHQQQQWQSQQQGGFPGPGGYGR